MLTLGGVGVWGYPETRQNDSDVDVWKYFKHDVGKEKATVLFQCSPQSRRLQLTESFFFSFETT